MRLLDDEIITSLEMDWPAFCDQTREQLLHSLDNPDHSRIVPPNLIPSAKTKAFQVTAMSGLILRAAAARRWPEGVRVGICGFDLPGKLHALMLPSLLENRIEEILVYGARPDILGSFPGFALKPCEHWRTAYSDTDIFIASSASPSAYIDALPKHGSVHMNLSLHDYFPSVLKSFGVIGIDQWAESETLHKGVELVAGEYSLASRQLAQLPELIDEDFWSCLPVEDTVVFNVLGGDSRNRREIP